MDYHIELDVFNNNVCKYNDKKELIYNIKQEMKQLYRLSSTRDSIEDSLDEIELDEIELDETELEEIENEIGVLYHKIDNIISNTLPPPRPDKSFLHDARRNCHILREQIIYIEGLKRAIQNNEQKQTGYEIDHFMIDGVL